MQWHNLSKWLAIVSLIEYFVVQVVLTEFFAILVEAQKPGIILLVFVVAFSFCEWPLLFCWIGKHLPLGIIKEALLRFSLRHFTQKLSELVKTCLHIYKGSESNFFKFYLTSVVVKTVVWSL